MNGMETNTNDDGSNLVVVDYADIVGDTTENLARLLAKAFGGTEEAPNRDESDNNENSSPSGSSSRCKSLGIIAIRNVPGFTNAKDAFLPLAYKLAHLPRSYLENSLTDERSMYNAGWSHGKEKLGDKPDYAKGSFYFNPLTDTPGSEEDRKRYPASYPCNIWPDKSAIPGFEAAAKHLGCTMHDAVVHLSKHIDAYAKSRASTYPDNLLYEAMKHTEKAKGRLLYYFPLDEKEQDNTKESSDDDDVADDSWIGWHNDSGFLTALAGDMYVNHETGERLDPQSIDPDAGLCVLNRNGTKTHVVIPEDCMAVQLGECVQIITGGAVIATPHCVRGAKSNSAVGSSQRVARISHPCFIDTVPSFPLSMPSGVSRNDVIASGVDKNAPVPPLDGRWTEDGMTFGDFLQKTFSVYYDWSSSKDSTK